MQVVLYNIIKLQSYTGGEAKVKKCIVYLMVGTNENVGGSGR
jgi:hypothetical protein